MNFRESIIRVWQRASLSWREGLVVSPFGRAVRVLANQAYPEAPRDFQLAEPLRGCRMRLHWQFHKAFVFGTYECRVSEVIQQVVRPGWLALDIGAYLGYYTLLLSKQVGRKGKVIAFEPLSDNFQMLRTNIELNACANVVLENKAVADRTCRRALARNNADALSATASLVWGSGGEALETVSLDGYLAGEGQRVAFIKADVEGAELLVLEGMTEILGRDRPLLLMELHTLEQYGARHPAVAKLREIGYSVRGVDTPGAQGHILAEPLA